MSLLISEWLSQQCRQCKANLEASAYETCSNEEDGEASNHGGKASLQHARGHEGEQHCQPAAGDLGSQNAPICLNEGVAFRLQKGNDLQGSALEQMPELTSLGGPYVVVCS